jgi:hypothetical protein
MLQRSVEMDAREGKVNLLAAKLLSRRLLHFTAKPARKRHG